MPITKASQQSFAGGILSPLLHRRDRFEGYSNAAHTLENFFPLKEGALVSRPGSHYVTPVKIQNNIPRMKSFIFSQEQSYVLEFGNFYVRFYRNEAILGVPYEVVTPYGILDVHDLDFEQSADVLYIAHPNYPLAALKRYNDLDWKYETITLAPPPVHEKGYIQGTTVTLSATTGSITLTGASGIWLEADVGRIFEDSTPGFSGQASITSLTSSTVANATVIKAFSQTTITGGNWKLKGSPAAIIHSTLTEPVGSLTDLTLLKITPQTELITNGGFTSDLSSWTDLSGGQIETATHAGTSNQKYTLLDTGKDFLAAGVTTNMIVKNTTKGAEGVVTGVTATTLYVNGLSNETDFDIGDNTTIHRTGSAKQSAGKAILDGGSAGFAWIEQGVSTTAGNYYVLSFRVEEAAITMMVGSASKLSDILPEAAYDIGRVSVAFRATSSTTYIGIRNNQPIGAKIDDVSVQSYEVTGWRSSDVGKYVDMNKGLIEITNYVSGSRVQGVIRKQLEKTRKYYPLPDSSNQEPIEVTRDSEAIAGAWQVKESRFTTSKYPGKVALYQERLWLNSPSDPLRLYGSKTGDFHNFATGTNDDDAIEFVIASSQINNILWLEGGRTLNAGTEAAEFIIQGALGEAVKPSTITANPISFNGSANVPPLLIGNSLHIFVQRGGLKVIALDYSSQQQSVVGSELTVYINDVLPSSIVQLAYQAQPHGLIWARCEDGTLWSCSYSPEQKVLGWAQHDVGGFSVDQICVIPAENGSRDQLWLVVHRLIQGNTQRYIEYLDDHNSKNSWGKLTVDSALQYDGASTTTLTGLSHLEGQAVNVISNNTNFSGTFTVSGGQITLPSAVTKADVGLAFTPKVRPLRPAIDRQGVILTGERIKTIKITMTVYKSLGGTVYKVDGTKIYDIPYRTATMPMNVAPALFTGQKEFTYNIDDTENADISFIIQQDLPYPLTILDLCRDINVPNLQQ